MTETHIDAIRSPASSVPASPDSLGALPALDAFLCFNVYATGLAFNRVYRKPLERLGLTYPQYLAMVALWNEDAMTVGQLGERLSLETNTLTPLLKRLEAMGLIVRRRPKEDERRVIISLTEEGLRLRAASEEVMRCIGEAIGMDADALATLSRGLDRLRANLKAAAAEA
jgi:DNA-binding MarR family transcriptional regulator